MNQGDDIKVSVCIPTYARLAYLKKAFESIKQQTYQNIEICISQNPKNGLPKPGIKQWCEKQVARGLLKYNINATNLGLSGNLNVLTRLASGDYIIFLGDDDMLQPTFIETLIFKAAKTNAGVIFCNQVFIDENDTILKETEQINKDYGRTDLEDGLVEDTLSMVFRNSIPLSASLIKRNLLLEFPFDEDLNTPEFPVFLKIALKEQPFYYINQQLAYYRIHSKSETAGGLTIHKLLRNVIPIKVPSSHKSKKMHFISSKIIPAINMSLRSGDKLLAKYLLNSGYYPQNEKMKKFIQKVLLFMPFDITRKLL